MMKTCTKPITDFTKVTKYTSLRTINLDWKEEDLPEHIRTKHVHRLHPYLGKFIPQLVEIFLRKYKPRCVYDPFCGSGTTLVEANALGIDSIGCDISAFNCLLSKVKTNRYNISLLKDEIYDVLDNFCRVRDELPLFNKGIGFSDIKDTNNHYLKTWYAEKARKELLYFKSLICKYTYQDVLKVILSRAARSSRLTTHYDLDFPKKPQTKPYECYKHGRTCYPTDEAYKFIKRYALDCLKRIEEYNKIRTNASVKIIHGDSRTIELPNKIDFIFTSPPYVGLIDYHSQHKYAYELLKLEDNENLEIGAAKKGCSKRAQEDYIKQIKNVFLNSKKHMKKDAIVCIVVHDGKNLYNANDIGFKLLDKKTRHVNRRTGRRNGEFYEDVLIWRNE